MEAQCDPRFLKGIEEFNQRRFFECHETLEEIWWEEQGQDRLFYQGIIQIAVGYLKYKEGVLIGAIKLWRSGLEKLEAYPPAHLGIDLVPFIQAVAGDLKEIELAHEKGEGAPVLHAPRISLSA
ncbi:MAG: DUF309 domain-containing protein [Deltaproteobacteria bacterium]|nr:DUF309 domain-containing protein [Deltaproteobacteria bacterium]